MDESKALHQLTESADLISMLEALSNVASADQIAPTSWAGFRVTLRNVRETILASHDSLASNLLQRAKARIDFSTDDQVSRSVHNGASAKNGNSAEAPPIKFERRDLKASLEKYVEKTNS